MIRACYVWSQVAALVVIALALAGCEVAPAAIYLEAEHTSHPFAGEPFGPASEEDGLTVANFGAEWVHGNAYLQSGLGWKLAHEGFKGPDLTFNIRAGYRFKLKGRAP